MNKSEIGKRIKQIRLSLGSSMIKFGEQIDEISPVKSGVISNWENGKQIPNKKRISKIAKLGNISINELLYGNPSTFLFDNLNIYDEYSFGNLADLSFQGRMYIVQMCIQEYLKFKAKTTEKNLKSLKNDGIKDYGELLSFSNNNLELIIQNMISIFDNSLKSLENIDPEKIKKVSGNNFIYEKYLNNEEITVSEKLNNFGRINVFELKNLIYKHEHSENYPIINILNDLIKYSIYISNNNQIDQEIIDEIENFLASNIRVDLETELFKNTLLENSYLSDYIKNHLVVDMEELEKGLNSVNPDNNSQ